MLEERLEQRFEPTVPRRAGQLKVGVVGVERRAPAAGVAVHDREANLVLVGVEIEEQLLDLVHHVGDTGVAAVHLVDHHDDGQAPLERLAQHEAGLGQRTLGRVYKQQDAVDHGEAALYLAAEVGVARRVDDVDLHPAEAHRRVLGQDRDALLALEVRRVEHSIDHLLVRPKRPGLTQQRIDQRGLAVVDMGDDRHITDITTRAHREGLFELERGTSQSTGSP